MLTTLAGHAEGAVGGVHYTVDCQLRDVSLDYSQLGGGGGGRCFTLPRNDGCTHLLAKEESLLREHCDPSCSSSLRLQRGREREDVSCMTLYKCVYSTCAVYELTPVLCLH